MKTYLPVVLCLLLGCHDQLKAKKEGQLVFEEVFDGQKLDPGKWVRTSAGDFQKKAIVLDAGEGGRLRLMAATVGSDPKTVKYLGLRTAKPFNLRNGARIRLKLDWNRQRNGSYMTASFYLSPTATAANPWRERNWLRFGYVGVPPGQAVRGELSTRINGGATNYLKREGWPKKRKGRTLSRAALELRLEKGGLRLYENGKLYFETKNHGLKFDRAYLYLQMSSHSNYRAREIFFDDISVIAK